MTRFSIHIAASAALLIVSCGGGPTDQQIGDAPSAQQTSASLSGSIRVDGSSTVFPITAAVAEEFQAVNRGVRVTVSYSGTGGGFEKFTNGETDISDASRPIRQSEIDRADEAGLNFIELPVAYDGLSVIVNPQNDWVDHLTVDELRRIWEPGSTVSRWSDVRPDWPARPIHLYGAGTDSGTFDYFTEAIMHEAGAMRSDYTASEDDNLLVQGVSGDVEALGFFGYAYYHENSGILRLVPIDGGAGPVEPTPQTIEDGTYSPLSRPLFIYISQEAANRPEIDAFIEFYMENASDLVGEVGYIALPPDAYGMALRRYRDRVMGSVFAGAGSQIGVTIADLLAREEN